MFLVNTHSITLSVLLLVLWEIKGKSNKLFYYTFICVCVCVCYYKEENEERGEKITTLPINIHVYVRESHTCSFLYDTQNIFYFPYIILLHVSKVSALNLFSK